jgi:hypothetical protein
MDASQHHLNSNTERTTMTHEPNTPNSLNEEVEAFINKEDEDFNLEGCLAKVIARAASLLEFPQPQGDFDVYSQKPIREWANKNGIAFEIADGIEDCLMINECSFLGEPFALSYCETPEEVKDVMALVEPAILALEIALQSVHANEARFLRNVVSRVAEIACSELGAG